MRRLFFGLVVTLLAACAPVDTGECASPGDCGATEDVCDGCPPLGDSLCVGGVCEDRAADAIEVTATVSLDRDIANDVESFVHSLIASSSCDVLAGTSIVPSANVLATGFKNVSGGAFHPDVNLGRAPDQEISVVVVAFDDSAGQGSPLGAGCAGPLQAESGEIIIDLLSVVP